MGPENAILVPHSRGEVRFFLGSRPVANAQVRIYDPSDRLIRALKVQLTPWNLKARSQFALTCPIVIRISCGLPSRLWLNPGGNENHERKLGSYRQYLLKYLHS